MKRYGFTYSVAKSRKSPPEAGIGIRYGIIDPAAALREGYGVSVTDDQADETPLSGKAEAAVLNGLEGIDPDTLPESQDEAVASARKSRAGHRVNGVDVPMGGCVRESFLKLYAPHADAVDILFTQDLERESYGKSRADSRVEGVINSWSTCMKRNGYRVTDPVSPVSQLNLAGDLSGDTAIALAVEDVECKKQTGLVGVWFAVESAYQKRLIKKNAQVLSKVKEQHHARMRLAHDLLR